MSPTNTRKNTSYKIQFRGALVAAEAESMKLSPLQTAALHGLGLHTVNLAVGVMQADSRTFGALMQMSADDFNVFRQSLSALAAPTSMAESEREQLSKLPCTLGFDYDHMPPQSMLRGDSIHSLRLAGFTSVSDEDLKKPGHDLIDDMAGIRNQGMRGTCVAHTVTRCYEHLEHKKSGKPGTNKLDYSEQFLYWNAKKIDKYPDAEGTWVRHAVDAITQEGICSEATEPYYEARYPFTDSSQRGPKPSPAAYGEALGHRPDRGRRLQPTDVEALKMVIAGGHPVAYAIPVYRSWYYSAETRDTGFITLPLGSADVMTGGHAITLTGWGLDSDVPGGGYFIFDNSWSSSWAPKNQFGAGRGILPFAYAAKQAFEAWILEYAS